VGNSGGLARNDRFRPIAVNRTVPYPSIMSALRATKWSLILLVIPALFVSLLSLQVGLTFGFNLWRSDRPFAIAMWFGVVFFPVLLLAALRSVERPRRFWILAAAAWSFVAFWFFHQVIWMPWTFGGPWGW
jgi:hypothetical protein